MLPSAFDPGSMSAAGAQPLWRRDLCRGLARKLLIFGLAITLVIPASVMVSDLIEDTYQTSIDQTLETAREATREVEDSAGQVEEDQGFLDGLLSKVTESVSGVASGLSEKVGDMVNGFLEALAVMLVTSCVIPLLVLAFFVWLVKTLFNISVPAGNGAISGAKSGSGSQQTKETPL